MRTIHSHHARSWTGSPTLENSQSTTATAVKLRHQRARCLDQIAVDDDRVVGLSCNGVQFAKDPAAGHPNLSGWPVSMRTAGTGNVPDSRFKACHFVDA